MTRLALLACLLATPAFAHIDEGTWKGTTADGKECSLVAGQQYFERDLRHPLNERIPVTVDGTAFTLPHPSSIDAAKAQVGFDHDRFHGLLPNPTGADAIEVQMEHSESFEGPRSFTLIRHNWKTRTSTSLTCSGLSLQK